MTDILYVDVCDGLPLEYCQYHPKYDKCLEWLKTNHPDLFAIEIVGIQERNPKIAKKTQHLWDENAPSPEQKNNDNQQSKKKKRRPRKKKSQQNNDNDDQNDNDQQLQTKRVQILEQKVNEQQQISNDQIADLQSKFAALSTNGSPNKSILKNPENPNFTAEKEKMDSMGNSDENEDEMDFYGRGGNRNKARGPPPRKDTKQKKGKRGKKKGKNRGKKGRNQQNEDEDENKENDDETAEDDAQKVKFYEQNKNKKAPKNAVEVSLENRKGNKKVTVVRGFIEKSTDKEQRIKSEFMKKFATSVMITYQNQGSDKGPKQVVLMGDKRYDFMKYLKDKFPKAGKLLYYKSKRWGMTPAVDTDHGFVMPPP